LIRHAKELVVAVAIVSFAIFSPATAQAEVCPNEAIRIQQHATQLPDCRAYELVSPVKKGGGDVMGDTTRVRSSADGDALQFSSLVAFADPQGTTIGIDYIARRAAAGWNTHAITPAQEPFSFIDLAAGAGDNSYVGEFSSDLSKGVFLSPSPLTADEPNVADLRNIYLRTDLLSSGPGDYTLLGNCLAPPAGPCASPLSPAGPTEQAGFAGASADFSRIIFESPQNLTLDAAGTLPKLYEWEEGTVRLAGILPDAACATPPCPAESSAAGKGAATFSRQGRYTDGTISDDGSRVLFTSPVNEQSNGTADSDLYLRSDHAETVQVNAEERTVAPDPPAPAPASFEVATPDLSQIFFVSKEQLTDDDDNGVLDIFRYDATKPASDPHNLTRLSLDTEPDDGSGGMEGVIGVSDAGDYVYFIAANQYVDDGVPGATEHPCAGTVQGCIFVWHDGVIREVTGLNSSEGGAAIGGEWSVSGGQKLGRVTPDGTHLLFVSEGPTMEAPYDHGDQCQGTNSGGLLGFFNGNTPECLEMYVYDANANGGAGQLLCASCNPGGTHTSATEAGYNYRLGASASSRSSHLNHPLSADGRFVFFSTGEALVPADSTNGTYDVYEFDTASGQQRLLSSGTDPDGSFFLEASPDGEDVFIRTRARLVGWDTDRQFDVYDVRLGGGFPEPVVPTAPCSADSCQGSFSVPSAATSPGSASVTGPPDRVHPRRCPRGRRVTKASGGKSRCVKKRRPNHNRRTSR
jgi:hypothetical protein